MMFLSALDAQPQQTWKSPQALRWVHEWHTLHLNTRARICAQDTHNESAPRLARGFAGMHTLLLDGNRFVFGSEDIMNVQ